MRDYGKEKAEMKKKILLLISFACVIILAINDIYCSKHKNQEEDIIKIEKNNKIEQKNPMDYIQFLQWRKNYVKEKPNHSKFMDTWRSVQI